MSSIAAYRVLLDQPTDVWDAAISLLEGVEEPKGYVAMIQCFAADDTPLQQRGNAWKLSTNLHAEFTYIPLGSAGEVVKLPTYRTDGLMSRVSLDVAAFGTRQESGAVVGTLFYAGGVLPSSSFRVYNCVAGTVEEP